MIKLYVYGTLRKGGENHNYYLKDAKFKGYFKLLNFEMVIFSYIPYSYYKKEDNKSYIIAELYEIENKRDLYKIDLLEISYKRYLLSDGAFIYLVDRERLLFSGMNILSTFVIKDYMKQINNCKCKYKNLITITGLYPVKEVINERYG